MAKVLNPFFAGEARGSVGSITASRNRSGAIIRQNASPVQPRTNSQQSIRYNLQTLINEFQNLTSSQITDWNDFAAANPVTDVFGNSILLSGENWYVRLNSRLLEIGQSSQSTPPATANSDYTPTLSMAISSSGIWLTYGTAMSGNQRIWVQYSGNVPLSRNFLSKDTRQRSKLSSSDSSPQLIVADASLLTGTQRHLTAFAVDANGRATPKQRWSIEKS